MIPIIHFFASTTVILTVTTFWFTSLVSELFLGVGAITTVKHDIVAYGLAVLICAMLITACSGFILGKSREGRLAEQKKKRMPFIASIGLFVMVPTAFFLDYKASIAEFDLTFYSMQTVEFIMGSVQLALLGLNFRDGLKLHRNR